MPSWRIHDKWAERLGIDKATSCEVNKLIDDWRTHDWYRLPRDIDSLWLWFNGFIEERICEIYCKWGSDGVKALFLHAMLDYLADHLLLSDSIELSVPCEISERFPEEFQEVLNFVKENMDEIKKDIKSDPSFQKRVEKVLDFAVFSHETFNLKGWLELPDKRRINPTAAFQKARSIIKKGGKCRIKLISNGKEIAITSTNELINFIKQLKAKEVRGKIFPTNKEVLIILQ